MSTLKDWFRKMFGGPTDAFEGEEGLPPALRRGSTREQQLATLQAGYVEVLDLVRGIRGHLERQGASQEKLLDLLSTIGESAAGLKDIGKTAEKQTETLQLMRAQLEQSVDQGHKLVGSLDRFNTTMQGMDRSSRETAGTLTSLVESMRNSESIMREHLEKAERRMAIFVGVLVVALLGATAVALLYRAPVGASRTDQAAERVPVALPDESKAAESTVADRAAEWGANDMTAEQDVVDEPETDMQPEALFESPEPQAHTEPAEGGLGWARVDDALQDTAMTDTLEDNAVPNEVTNPGVSEDMPAESVVDDMDETLIDEGVPGDSLEPPPTEAPRAPSAEIEPDQP